MRKHRPRPPKGSGDGHASAAMKTMLIDIIVGLLSHIFLGLALEHPGSTVPPVAYRTTSTEHRQI